MSLRSDSDAVPTPIQPPLRDAPAPFNKPTADLILRSSDSVGFRVRKAILAEASSVFEDMFSLPSIPQTHDPDSDACGVPVVEVTEGSRTLECLLRLCYPVDEMPLRTLGQASGLLEAARKYAMDGALRYLGQRLLSFAEASPVQVFALAVRFELEHEVELAAARAFLNFSASNDRLRGLKDLRHISASAYLSLLDYRDSCATAAVVVFDDYDWIDPDQWCWLTCQSCLASEDVWNTFKRGRRRQRIWWTNMMARCRSLVLAKPSGRVLASQTCTAVALAEAGRCSYCGPRAPFELQEFMTDLIAEVDNAVEQVRVVFCMYAS